MGSIPNESVLDALIVGAGFGGVYQLKHLRDAGYKVKLVDFASDYAGVWYWNRYPGARVDSAVPNYEFSDPDLWREWNWSQRFPGSKELRDYFSFVADKWDLRKDTEFNVYISKATWNDETSTWAIESKDGGHVYHAKYFLLNTGFAAKRYTPDWKGIDRFSAWVHPSYWPKEEPDLRGKRVAVIGTGSTGVQIAQELSQIASELAIFQRTPNLALPMKQIDYTEKPPSKERYSKVFAGRHDSFGGFDFTFLTRGTFDDTPEQRQATYEELWEQGDFQFWLATYHDMLFREDANKEAYDFWKKKVRARIHDPRLKEVLAPDKQPYSFGFDINSTPVVEVTERGIRTTEKEWEFDYIVCATGFDAITGGLMNIDIRGRDQNIADKWKTGAKTYLGAHSAMQRSNVCRGTGRFHHQFNDYMKEKKLQRIDAEDTAEASWGDEVRKLAAASLLPSTKSWYMGDNIPGKPRECLIYLGGVPNYYKSLSKCSEGGYTGFTLF